ncbi:PREDICTED: UPF0496 protein At3g57100-like [Tarenaya hassleriana]|uniref:UPF0496 protein At3g57100-like n=1 Tax=Tarenaya hassleriana TaxID=28532 RepID=UPI00053C3825|nr:PREDICTED: UPF0496 protein At3g57100-like [Tarenaya hassleriana]
MKLKRRSSASPSLSSRAPVDPENPEPVSNNGLGLRSSSYDSLNNLTGSIDNMNADVKQLFLSSQRDLRENPDLLNLINDFFDKNTALSVFCESLKRCLEKAAGKEALVFKALSDFMEEKRVSGEEGSFSKTLQSLRSFRDFSSYDPFAGEFAELYKSCHDDLVRLIAKLKETIKTLDRELQKTRWYRRFMIMVLIAAVSAVIVGAIVVGVTVAPPLMFAMGTVVPFVPIGSLGVFFSTMLQKSRNALKRQNAAMSSMERGVSLALSEVDKIKGLVDKFEEAMKSMEETMDTAAAAAEKRSLLEKAMAKVEEDLQTYKKVISDLQREGGECDQNARLSREVARDKITQLLSE